MEKLDPLCIAGGNVKWYRTVENSLEKQVLKRLNLNYHIIRNSTPRYIPPEIKGKIICTKTYTCQFIAALFLIAKKWKQLKYLPSLYDGILFGHTKDSVLRPATKQINLEGVMLSERT